MSLGLISAYSTLLDDVHSVGDVTFVKQCFPLRVRSENEPGSDRFQFFLEEILKDRQPMGLLRYLDEIQRFVVVYERRENAAALRQTLHRAVAHLWIRLRMPCASLK